MDLPLEPAQLPLPVAVPLLRYRAAARPGEGVAHGADAGYAIVKYVALLRLADWIRAECPGEDDELVEPLDFALGGASANHWWQLSSYLVKLTPGRLLPDTPGWTSCQEPCAVLNRARKFRHGGLQPEPDSALELALQDAVARLLTAARPLLDLPLVRRRGAEREELRGPAAPPVDDGEWHISVESGEAPLALDALALVPSWLEDRKDRDVYIYERLSQKGIFAESRGKLIDTGWRHPSLGTVLSWIREQRGRNAIAVAQPLSQSTPEGLLALLRQKANERLDQEWRVGSLGPVPRPDVQGALSSLPASGVHVAIVSGPSGIGKTHELVQWLRRQPSRGLLWLRAPALRASTELLLRAVGAQLTGADATAPPRLVRAALERSGLAVGLDGVSETPDGIALARRICEDARELGIPLHLACSTRIEALAPLRHALAAASARAEGTSVRVVEVEPLPREAAARLWNVQAPEGAPRYEELSHATRQLLRVPMMTALALDASVFAADVSPEALVERFVEAQTSPLQRALLRRIAATMYRSGTQVLVAEPFGAGGSGPPPPAASHLDAGDARLLREAIQGEGPFADPFRGLCDRGLVAVTGRLSATEPLRLRLAHDRILQWLVARWLRGLARSGDGGVLGETWTAAHAARRDAPPLANAVGSALALLHADAPAAAFGPLLRDAAGRPLLRSAVAALAEEYPEAARRWLQDAWRDHSSWAVRRELVGLAADVGCPETLSEGLRRRQSRAVALEHLPGARRRDPESVQKALRAWWEDLQPRPWLHLPSLLRLGQALFVAQVAEGGHGTPDPTLGDLGREVASGALASAGGPWTSRALIEIGAALAAGIVRAVPYGPVDNVGELARFLRKPRSRRARFRPLVDAYRDGLAPDRYGDLAREIASRLDVGPTLLLERALIANVLRRDLAASTLDVTLELGRIAQAARPLPMAAQSCLYVFSQYLEKRPAAPDWEPRFLQFEELLRGWLDRSGPEGWRWTSSSGRRYKALFVAAHARLAQTFRGDGARVADHLWAQALGTTRWQRSRRLLDLLDEMAILAVSRGATELAAGGMEPLLRSSVLPRRVARKATEVLCQIDARDPLALDGALEGPGENRAELRRRMRTQRATGAAEYALFLDFDDAIVMNEALRETVADVLRDLLEAPSFRAFVRNTLRRTLDHLVSGDGGGARA